MTNGSSNILQLNNSNDFFNHFFVHNPAPMWVFDVATLSFLDVNLAAVNIYGYTREEFLLMTIRDIRPAEDIGLLENHINNSPADVNDDKRWRHTKKNGSSIWVTVSSFDVLFTGLRARLVTVNNITKYVEQETALCLVNRELKEYKKAITTSSLVSITNRKGIIQYANENFANLTGYTQDELIGRNHNIVNSGYHPHSFWQNMWQTILNGNTWRGEVCNRKKDGSFYWVDSFIIPITNDEGKIERIFSIRIDITERKKKETEVIDLNKQLTGINLELINSKKELEKLSLVAKLTASEVLILDRNRNIIWVNDAFTKLTGYSMAESYGRKPGDLLHGPKSNDETTKLIRHAIDNRQPFNTEVVHYSKTGEEFWLLTDGQPVLDENGGLLYYVIVETNITELKEKQKAVINSEIKLNAFFSSMANLHLLVDRNLCILAQNSIARDFAGSVMHTITKEGDYLPAKLLPELKDNFIYYANEAINGIATINRPVEFEVAGNMIAWQAQYLPAFDRSGNIIGCAFTANDVTDRKKAEDKVKRQNAILREIAWKQSHVVRAPIANILSINALLETSPADKDLLDALKHETNKLDGIIKDIVDKTIEIKDSE